MNDEVIFVSIILLILVIIHIIIDKGNSIMKKIDNLMDNVNKRMDAFFKNK